MKLPYAVCTHCLDIAFAEVSRASTSALLRFRAFPACSSVVASSYPLRALHSKYFSVRYMIFRPQQHLSPKPHSQPCLQSTNNRMFLKTRSTIDKAWISPLRPSHVRATKQTWLHSSAARVSQNSVARNGADAEGLETGTGNLSAPSMLKMAQIKRRHFAYVSGDCHRQPCRPS